MSEPSSISYFTPTLYDSVDWSQTPPTTGGVTLVGGGPVGLVTALGLARRGVSVTVLERKNRVGLGSKAAALSARSLEVLAGLGVAGPFLENGLPWDSGRSFFRGKEISRFRLVQTGDPQYPSLVNIPQPFIEQFLVDECLAEPLIDLRWGVEFEALTQDEGGVTLEVVTPTGRHHHRADWVVATDGARSTVRQSIGVSLEGRTYRNSFVICDLRMRSERGTERLCWFDPPAFPGRSVLLHQLGPELWRLDYQIREDDDLNRAIDHSHVAALVADHFDYIGETAEWEIEWASLYRAHARALDHFRDGRVLFAGDAAHILPVFGVRGLNSGFADAVNLAWKLALVAQGKAGDTLLDTYDWEQHDFFQQNRDFADHSTLYMAPDSPGATLARDASLSLALVRPDLEYLADPSYSSSLQWRSGPLIREDDMSGSLLRSGALVPNMPIGARQAYLNDAIGHGFTLVSVGEEPAVPAHDLIQAVTVAADCDLGRLLGVGNTYLLRPDRHVLRRWSCGSTVDPIAELDAIGIAASTSWEVAS